MAIISHWEWRNMNGTVRFIGHFLRHFSIWTELCRLRGKVNEYECSDSLGFARVQARVELIWNSSHIFFTQWQRNGENGYHKRSFWTTLLSRLILSIKYLKRFFFPFIISWALNRHDNISSAENVCIDSQPTFFFFAFKFRLRNKSRERQWKSIQKMFYYTWLL